MLYYITGNKDKLASANRRLAPYGIELEQIKLELIEPQSDNIEFISISKAEQAYQLLQQPVLVNDSAWYIKALNGFPGAYMAYMNKWLTAEDFLNLMRAKKDREVVLKEVVCYSDVNEHKIFKHELVGTVLAKPRGDGIASDTVISLQTSGRSIAECKVEGVSSSNAPSLWEDFANWYKAKIL